MGSDEKTTDQRVSELETAMAHLLHGEGHEPLPDDEVLVGLWHVLAYILAAVLILYLLLAALAVTVWKS